MSEKVLCYLGPSLPIQQAVEIAPDVIFRPPAIQGEILSDIVEFMPDRILLIDGQHTQNFSVWHKELVFALTHEIKVYGGASMGALRAADLWRQGMVGVGNIFYWYKVGLTEDESEVALLYTVDNKGNYHPLTIPLVDLWATLMRLAKSLAITVDHQEALLGAAKAIHYTRRTRERIIEAWGAILDHQTATGIVDNLVNQKAEDAICLLESYAYLEPEPESEKPDEASLTRFFWAQYDRDRKIKVEVGADQPAVRMAQQHVSDYIALHSTDHHQIFWDARNFHLAHMLAEKLGVQVTEPEVEDERLRFYVRHGVQSPDEAKAWGWANNLTYGEFTLLIVKMAIVRKMQEWLIASLAPMDCTKLTLDYLKIHGAYAYWAKECAQTEAKLQAKGVDENLLISPSVSIYDQLSEHCQKSGITLDGAPQDFVWETGFTSTYELGVALGRLKQMD